MPTSQARRAAVTRRASRRLAAWLALFGCLLQLLTPLAWAAGRDAADPLAGALAVCTPDGFRLIDPAGGDAPAEQKGKRPLCPACIATVAPAILTTPQQFVPLAPLRGAGPEYPLQERAAGERPLRLNPVRAPPLA